MVQQVINLGAVPDDGDGDPLRTAFQKTNANFSELYPMAMSSLQSWVPNAYLSGATGSVITLTYAVYTIANKRVFYDVFLTVTTLGTGGVYLAIPLPFPMSSIGSIAVGRNLGNGKMLQGQTIAGGLSEVRVWDTANALPVNASGQGVLLSGSYVPL